MINGRNLASYTEKTNLLRNTVDKGLIHTSGKDELSIVNNKGSIYK